MGLAVVLLLCACVRQPEPQVLPVPVRGNVPVRSGTRTIVEDRPVRRPPRLPAEHGVIAVEPFGNGGEVALPPEAVGEALRRWLEEHGDVVERDLGDRCGKRDPCLAVHLLPPRAPEPETSADVPAEPDGEAAREPAPEGEAEAAPAPAGRDREALRSSAEWILRGRILELGVHGGHLRVHVEAIAPGAEAPAMSGSIEAPSLAELAGRIAAAFFPPEEIAPVEREVPACEPRRRVVDIQRRPVTVYR